jgi:hypothetical protein
MASFPYVILLPNKAAIRPRLFMPAISSGSNCPLPVARGDQLLNLVA